MKPSQPLSKRAACSFGLISFIALAESRITPLMMSGFALVETSAESQKALAATVRSMAANSRNLMARVMASFFPWQTDFVRESYIQHKSSRGFQFDGAERLRFPFTNENPLLRRGAHHDWFDVSHRSERQKSFARMWLVPRSSRR